MNNTISLATEYAGLKLKNPFIVSSSGLTDTADKVRLLEQEGAAAVVLKSLFEEQIEALADKDIKSGQDYPEAYDYIRMYVRDHQIEEYLQLIKACKHAVSIPVIASINCYARTSWMNFAKEIEKAGADAIEVNIMIVNTSKEYMHGETERLYVDVLSDLKKIIQIPVIMKLSHQLTSPVALASHLKLNGADAVVLFNRSFIPDINIDTLKLSVADVFSTHAAFIESLRWVGIISGNISFLDISLSGGVHDPNDSIKAILAGASTVSLCSVLYKEGSGTIEKMKSKLTEWMGIHGFDSIKSFRGILNSKHIPDESVYERTQFIRYYSNRK